MKNVWIISWFDKYTETFHVTSERKPTVSEVLEIARSRGYNPDVSDVEVVAMPAPQSFDDLLVLAREVNG